MASVRTALHVPMLKEHEFLGAIMIYRHEVLAFTDKEVGLVENFAKQAAIAMENVRLMSETQEALDQQTATAEVLGVINASPGDLAPVFDAMLEKAIRTMRGRCGTLWTFDVDRMEMTASRGLSEEFVKVLRERSAKRHDPDNRDRCGALSGASGLVHILDLRKTKSTVRMATRI